LIILGIRTRLWGLSSSCILFEGYELPTDDDVFGGTHETVRAMVAEELKKLGGRTASV
jgi:hypothetical protein